MSCVYIGVGSNIDRQQYISLGLKLLAEAFGRLTLSSVYQSEAIGFNGPDFFNLVVAIETEKYLVDLAFFLRQIEYRNGRPANATRNSGRTLDLDILIYDDLVGDIEGIQLPRAEILYNAFVLQPLAEIAGERRHPVEGHTYGELWATFDKAKQRLRVVSFEGTSQYS